MKKILVLLIATVVAMGSTSWAASEGSAKSEGSVKKEGSATKAKGAKGKGGAKKAFEPKEKTMLFDGKSLRGWTFHSRGMTDETKNQFSVKDGVLDTSGKPSGYIATRRSYKNYKLHVEWRWVPDPPGSKRRGRNSGVLIHMSGEDKVWPKSIECQLMSGNAADFFVIDGTSFKEHAAIIAKAVAAAGDDEAKKAKASGGRRVPKQGASNEKPLGEWNSYDIVVKGDSIIPSVNGEQRNKATGCSVTEGKICLQSEGAPIQFRNVYIEPVK